MSPLRSLFKMWKSLSPSLGGGGGDGGAEQLRADEAAREAEMQAAIDQINTMFGIAPTATADPYAAQRGDLNAQLAAAQEGTGTYAGPKTGVTRFSADDAYEAPPLSQAQQIDALTAQLAALPGYTNSASASKTASKNLAARETAYSGAGSDIMDYYRTETDEQKGRSADIIAVDMARRGLTAGSAKTDVDADLTDQYNDMIQNFQTQTDGAVTGMKTADEQARLDLISRIRQGMDVNSAISGANAALSSNIAAASSAAKTVPIEGLFRDLDELYGQRKAYDAYQTAYDQVSGVPTPGGGKVSLGYES